MEQQPIPILPGDPGAQPPLALRAAWAKHIMYKSLLSELVSRTGKAHDTLPHKGIADLQGSRGTQENYTVNKDRICIVGAGAAGLYIAMMLKRLRIKNFDILEASDRVGGRCYTYTFPEDRACPHNYYDIGAMRIPDIPTMQSTMKLINILNLQDKKVTYKYNLGDEPSLHWYSHEKQPDGKKFDEAIKDIIKDVVSDFKTGFDKLMRDGDDNYSTRSWLMVKRELAYQDTVSGEASDTSTGLFDQAFTETICDYSDFQASKDANWYRLEGGMSVVTDAMKDRLASTNWPKDGSSSINVTCNTPVVALKDTGSEMVVTTTDGSGKNATDRQYDMVFNTTAMAPLQRMDLQGLDLPDDILTGIRALSYDRATKVAIKFKTRWWKGFYKDPGDFGGVSSTDLPISNVVYPSWDDGPDTPAVLMVSYSWAQDATRMGALVPDYDVVKPGRDERIVTLCLQNLVKLWSCERHPPSFDFLYAQYETHHAWAWSHDPYTGGAFALFGPGQFKHLYPPFQKMFCGKKFAMCGEALSAHHAWISGALDSAYATVLRWLIAKGDVWRIGELLLSEFGLGKGRHAAEVEDLLVMWTVHYSDHGEEKHV